MIKDTDRPTDKHTDKLAFINPQFWLKEKQHRVHYYASCKYYYSSNSTVVFTTIVPIIPIVPIIITVLRIRIWNQRIRIILADPDP